MACKRVLKELSDLKKNHVNSCYVGPVAEDLFQWQATITGPTDSPYSGDVFLVAIRFPPDYPFKHPRVLLAICSLLGKPNPDDPYEREIANMYKTDRVKYESETRRCTQMHAMRSDDSESVRPLASAAALN